MKPGRGRDPWRQTAAIVVHPYSLMHSDVTIHRKLHARLDHLLASSQPRSTIALLGSLPSTTFGCIERKPCILYFQGSLAREVSMGPSLTHSIFDLFGTIQKSTPVQNWPVFKTAHTQLFCVFGGVANKFVVAQNFKKGGGESKTATRDKAKSRSDPMIWGDFPRGSPYKEFF